VGLTKQDRPSLKSIFVRHFDGFANVHRLSSEMYRAARSIVHCRTAALGGHINSCPEGHFDQIAYNSCRHRSCPQCSWLAGQRWLGRWKNRLLPCPHHHIVFTLPNELNRLWRFNKAEYANTLFAAASQTLTELLGDPNFLGGRIGVLCALHTWKQTLLPHVHLHCLVTAGGLNQNDQWLSPAKSCLLPRKVLMLKFRGKFKAMLREKVRRGQIGLPPELTSASLDRLLVRLSRKPWNVKIHEAYQHGAGVVIYLARYLKGGPIAASRLVADRDGQVTFRYRLGTHQGGDGKCQGTMSLPADTFLSRWLEHVPPHRFQTVRGYGLYSGNQHSRLADARKALGGESCLEEDTDDPSWQQLCELAGMDKACRCPQCGRMLVAHHEFKPGRSPPQAAAWLTGKTA
jgi:hypothetical protein